MTVAAAADPDAIRDACRRFGVARLRIFGSAVTGTFDPTTSDLDFLVDFQEDRDSRFEDFFGLQEALEHVAGRPVDLVTTDSLRNPYFRESVLATAEDVYAS
ncbi:toxin-antitoxin system toxin subunit [Actinomyces sp. 2119]|uniref:Toxin-antitoxin system toxin subunit n=1 Tax=Actinomyces lilanjuaniae TaxID=2321394 RepID=A0ABM6Z2C4_9ACTO|nr:MULTISPECIES: nucleotidyltransferase family protein [Actinomyces]AYD89413.1 toxin-antitoxin system toxin subunit [Actinomyces lilanjuaniae]RJF43228.1 toxin-antitoxin system toxin subunit [Actinomyces sp. 2119]